VTTTRLNSRRAAFFDVDKTLLPGSSLYLFARGLYRRGFYDLRDIAGFAFGQLVFRLTGAEGRKGMEAAREQALAFIEGKRRDDLTQIGHDIVVEVIGPRIYPGMRRVIDEHHDQGDRTFLVTAAPRELAQGIASAWLILAMWCLFGALLGFAFRSVALPVGLGVVWVLGVENLISSVADSLLTSLQPLRNLLPATNAGSLVWALAPGGGAGEPPPGVVDAVTGTRALVTLVAYLAVFAAGGALLLRRRDVS
jgi:hypothetical protein